ncbi:MAG: hemolysin family protein [Planctomycetaceae bacterium]|nr:hemolysin family protein [Planctomycetaceae bacterium]
MISASVALEYLLQLILMVFLLCCSAFCSGSETAYFQLSRRTVRQFASSSNRLERLTARVLQNPNRFLTALLLSNLTVNILFFSISGTLAIQTGGQYGPLAGTATGVLCFIVLLLGGEMLPKSLAYGHAQRIALLTSPITYVLVRVLSPVLKILDVVFIRPAVRLSIGPQKTGAISVNQFKLLLESSRRQGLISQEENQLMMEILKLNYLKVRHVMMPRVEMRACAIDVPVEAVKQRLLSAARDSLPVYKDSIDEIVGLVYLRDIVLHPENTLSELIRKVPFVPEQKSLESLIDFFRQTQTDRAIVVDEYGGVAGLVELDDITEHLLGTVAEFSQRPPIERLGPLTYRLLANLSIYDWMESFGLDDFKEERLTTIGGFITAVLGRIPKSGDQVKFKNMTFTVEKISNNRIETVVLSLEPTVPEDTNQPA